jgi:hypothetical protein
MSNDTKPMDDTRAILIAEGEIEADDETVVAAWQHLIDTGMCWRLQGWFGRAATNLIEQGVCTAPVYEKRQTGTSTH